MPDAGVSQNSPIPPAPSSMQVGESPPLAPPSVGSTVTLENAQIVGIFSDHLSLDDGVYLAKRIRDVVEARKSQGKICLILENDSPPPPHWPDSDPHALDFITKIAERLPPQNPYHDVVDLLSAITSDPVPELALYPFMPAYNRAEQKKPVPFLATQGLRIGSHSHEEFVKGLSSNLKGVSNLYVSREIPTLPSSLQRVGARAAQSLLAIMLEDSLIESAKSALFAEKIMYQGAFYNLLTRDRSVAAQADQWLKQNPNGTVIVTRGSDHASFFCDAVDKLAQTFRMLSITNSEVRTTYNIARQADMMDPDKFNMFCARLLIARVSLPVSSSKDDNKLFKMLDALNARARRVLENATAFDPYEWVMKELPLAQGNRESLRQKASALIDTLSASQLQ